MNRFPHLAQRIFNTPLLIHPIKAEIITAAIEGRLGVAEISHGGQPPELFMMGQAPMDVRELFGNPAEGKVYSVEEGIAIIPVEGTLVQKLGFLQPFSGMTGYDGLRECFLDALQDPDIRAIVLQIDSPGGEVPGSFTLADTIYAARGTKPIWAILDEGAYSAAYLLASAADRIVAPCTGGAGSIGVIAMFADLSVALSNAGIRINIIQFGARKSDGNDFEPLPRDARANFQAQIDALGEMFVETVARNRGITANAVRDTEAATFLAADAEKLGLVDAVMSPDAAFAELLASLP
jgi:signal peptide peptidase SppA